MKWTIALVLSYFAVPASADEYYEFFAIRCAPPVLFASIESVGMWNIGEYVWPGAGFSYEEAGRKAWLEDEWRRHEDNLKALEDKYGLYVFGEAYGRYAAEPIVCENAEYRLHISADPVERPYVNDDDIVVRYRGPMKVRIELKDGRVAFEGGIDPGNSIRVDRDELETCSGAGDDADRRKVTCTRKPLRPL